MIFFRFSKKSGFWVFLVHPPMALVLLSALVERCFVSRIRDFFWIIMIMIPSLVALEDTALYAGLLLAPLEGFGLRPRLFFSLLAKKVLIMLFWPIFGNFWCPVVTLVTFISNLSEFERNTKKPKNLKKIPKLKKKIKKIKKKSKKLKKNKS